MMLSIGFRNLVSLLPAIQATRLLTLTSVGFYPPLNTPAFAGHTTGRARFEHPAFRQTSPKWLTDAALGGRRAGATRPSPRTLLATIKPFRTNSNTLFISPTTRPPR